MDISELAQAITSRFDVDETAAERTAEIYLSQIEGVDGRTIDRDDIDGDDARFVLDAFEAGSRESTSESQNEDELYEISRFIRDRQSELADLTDRRNELIVRLLDRAVSVGTIVDLTGLTRARVYAIRDAAR